MKLQNIYNGRSLSFKIRQNAFMVRSPPDHAGEVTTLLYLLVGWRGGYSADNCPVVPTYFPLEPPLHNTGEPATVSDTIFGARTARYLISAHLNHMVVSQVHVVVEEQRSRGDDAHQGVGGGQRRRNGRPLFPGEQSPQRALHLPRTVGGESAEPRPPPSHRRQLGPLRRAASHLCRTGDSLGVRLALRRTERGTDVAAVLSSPCHHHHHHHHRHCINIIIHVVICSNRSRYIIISIIIIIIIISANLGVSSQWRH